ncbi:alanine racemase [Pseudidiomarina salinarum]|uniref:alanine racemase n=1 Tax=Pseudidiomarina salinarum TaxID=435908 RepID=UPI0005594872|nr:alanine racemase [Pseudidiomarina salinarum]RUO71234.1 alanine racemase [Pseudidiomarina salinarum]
MSWNWYNVSGPTVVVDKKKAMRNIERMQAKAKAAEVRLRPHFKTHQSDEIGSWFRDSGAERIAVSSVPMAEQFAAAGWKDILIAIPLNPRQLSAYNALATQTRLGLTVEHKDALEAVEELTEKVDLYVEIDAGYGRTGIPWTDPIRIDDLLHEARQLPQVRQLGLLLHAGNSYNRQGDDEIAQIHEQSLGRLDDLVSRLTFPRDELLISVGDTPTCSRMDSFPGADEIRPGNYVFYDLMQQQIGACDWQDIALAVACPVIARYPERGEVVVHGGAVHFSKDRVTIDGVDCFGQVMQLTAEGWGEPVEGALLHRLSQEHGKVKVPDWLQNKLQLGDLLVIVPAHSCLVMDASKGQCQIID